jgi:hypothetical protein
MDDLLYAGVRLIPVTGTSRDISRGNFPNGIPKGSISLKPASGAGLKLGAGDLIP